MKYFVLRDRFLEMMVIATGKRYVFVRNKHDGERYTEDLQVYSSGSIEDRFLEPLFQNGALIEVEKTDDAISADECEGRTKVFDEALGLVLRW